MSKCKKEKVNKNDYKCPKKDYEEYCRIHEGLYFTQNMNYHLNNLSCMVHSNKNKDEIQKYVDDLFDYLMKNRNHVRHYKYWVRLYSLSTHLYRVDNYKRYIGKIPVYKMTKHNFALANWINELLENDCETIIHFDTHADMNYIIDSNKIMKKFKQIDKKGDVKPYISDLEKLVWDIGSPVTGLLYYLSQYTKNDVKVLWAVPKWIPEKQLSPLEDVIKKPFNKKNIYLRNNDSENTIEYSVNKKKNSLLEFSFISQRFDNLKKYKEVVNFVDHRNFILDIDLDYFVSNGTPYSKINYLEGTYDVSSDKRVSNQFFSLIEKTPRDPFDSDDYFKYVKDTEVEIKAIEKRVVDFTKGLKYMKKEGLNPIAITISDSTSVDFSNCGGCHSNYNEYVPQNYALWLHKLVYSCLEDIYG